MTFAAFCPNCGSARTDKDEFCRSCGTSLRVPNAVNPSATPASGAAPTSPVSDTAAMAPATAPGTHPEASIRMPVTRLIAIVVGASLVVAAIAVALTFLLAAPPASGGPTPGTGNLQVVDVQYIRAEVPASWDVRIRARDTVAVEDPASRALWLRSAGLPTAITMDRIQERFLDKARRESPDAAVCAGPETAAVPGGPTDGRYFVICSTFVPQGGGRAVRLADAYYLGLDGPATTVFVLQLTAVPEDLEAFASTVRGLPPPAWKLYGG